MSWTIGQGGSLVSAAASPLSVRDQDMPTTSAGVIRSISAWPAASPRRRRSAVSSLPGTLNTNACSSPKAAHSSAEGPASRVPPGSPISPFTLDQFPEALDNVRAGKGIKVQVAP